MSQERTKSEVVANIITQPEKQHVIRRPRSESQESSSTMMNDHPTVTTDAGEYNTDIPTPRMSTTMMDISDSYATTNNSSEEVANSSLGSSCHQEQLGVAVLTPETDNETSTQRQTQSDFPSRTGENVSAAQLLSANNVLVNEMSLCPWNYTLHTDETR